MKKVKMHGVEFDFMMVEELNEIIDADKLTEVFFGQESIRCCFCCCQELVFLETDEKGKKIYAKCTNGCDER